jgi:ribonuclease HI
MFGGEPDTTNNRMELKAVIKALNAVKEYSRVVVNVDSEYVKHGITEWIVGWKARGWKRSTGKGLQPVKNQDLWMELDHAASKHRIDWNCVRGHTDHADNLRCDHLARKAACEQIASMGVSQTTDKN